MNSERLIKKLLREDVEDASKLLGLAINKTQEQLFANLDYEISNFEFENFISLVDERKNGKPFAYIKGTQGFYEHEFLVSPSTLIPRPESELLIYKLVNYFKNRRINILDIGTGSGCLLLSLLKELHLSRGIGIDISSKAVKTAEINSNKLNLFQKGISFSEQTILSIAIILLGSYIDIKVLDSISLKIFIASITHNVSPTLTSVPSST